MVMVMVVMVANRNCDRTTSKEHKKTWWTRATRPSTWNTRTMLSLGSTSWNKDSQRFFHSPHHYSSPITIKPIITHHHCYHHRHHYHHYPITARITHHPSSLLPITVSRCHHSSRTHHASSRSPISQSISWCCRWSASEQCGQKAARARGQAQRRP